MWMPSEVDAIDRRMIEVRSPRSGHGSRGNARMSGMKLVSNSRMFQCVPSSEK